MVEGKNNKQKNRTKYFLPGGKKQIQAVCAFLFLGVLILSCGVNLMHKDRQMSEKEMRMLAQKPEISLSGIASGRFMEQYEEYVSDQFAGRDTWVRIKTFADSVAGRTEEGGVFKGKDHYLMEDVAVADESDLKENLDAMKNFKERYPDIQMHMMLVPNAANVMELFLLFLVNLKPEKEVHEKGGTIRKPSRARHTMRLIVTRVVPALLVIVITAGGFFYNSKTKISGAEKVIVYNWGEYLDPDVLDIFEEETGIQVVYEEYETNEIMYPKVQSGAISYDVVCPSDYMIQRMIENDLLAEINWDNIPNIKNIGQTYMDQSKAFDPENKYSVPYCWGTVGILYNKTMVDEPIDSWSVLWDPKYKDSILMQDSVRDAFGVTLKYLGYSLNSTDLDELNEAKNLLIKQKPLVQAYVVDQVRDKMIGNEAAIGVIYSGEAIYTQKENPNLEYVIPKEGSNIWIDSWVIPKNAEHKENAEKFINFLCRPDIALKNFEYITYSTPNEAARELIEDESIRNSKIAFPDASELSGCETFKFLGDKNDAVYNELWREVKSK